MPNLIIERGREKGVTLALKANAENVVGRDPATVQLVISDVAASRRHFQIFERGGKWFVTDLGSRNGTFLNEEKVEGDIELAAGDRVQVGETVFSFLEEEKAEAGKAGGLQGREIGGYEIMERIGRGGMGTVYKARQKSMNRIVALKFLSPKLSSNPAFVNQFRAEARAAGQLNHPNVVQALDVFELNGLHCFSMEFMEGGCVQDLLSKRDDSRLPWEEAMPILLDATRGLVFAEKRGIIHRDIKPDNLMLTSEQKVKIGDLGLAKSAEDGDQGGTGIFGTPHFIAPEQAQGKPVNHAADIYSLGATLYRVVGGRTPFSGSTVKEILKAQINDPHKPMTELVPDFPKDLSAIIDKMMAKKVEDRYQSAAKLLEDLEAFMLAHHIEMAGGVKSRKPFLIGMGVLVVALGGVIYWAVTKPKEKGDKELVYVPSTAPVAQTGPVKTPEEIQAEFDQAAQIAFLSIKTDDATLGPVSLEKKDEFTKVAERYGKLRTLHPNARKHVGEAATRAKEIKEKLTELEQQKREVLDKATAWWTKTKSDIDAAVSSRNWAEAMRLASLALKSAEWPTHKPHCPPNAESFLTQVQPTSIAAATTMLSDKQQRATKLISERSYRDGIKELTDFETEFESQVKAVAGNQIDDGGRFAQLFDQAKTWRLKQQETLTGLLQKELEADKKVFVDAYLSVRHRSAGEADTTNKVFDYKFAEAAQDLRAATDGKLLTYVYRDRAEAKIAALGRMQAAFDEFVKLVAERKLFAGGEEIKGMPGMEAGTKALFDGERGANGREIFMLRALSSGGSSKTQRSWSDLTPNDLFRVFLRPKMDKLPPELAASLSVMFAELGDEDATGELIDRAKSGGLDEPGARAELTAIQGFTHISKLESANPADVKAAVNTWRGMNSKTDFFILYDGRPAAEITDPLFAEEATERFMANWGAKVQ